jgi:hypothetical protein
MLRGGMTRLSWARAPKKRVKADTDYLADNPRTADELQT